MSHPRALIAEQTGLTRLKGIRGRVWVVHIRGKKTQGVLDFVKSEYPQDSYKVTGKRMYENRRKPYLIYFELVFLDPLYLMLFVLQYGEHMQENV